jgi:HI0933-like protein
VLALLLLHLPVVSVMTVCRDYTALNCFELPFYSVMTGVKVSSVRKSSNSNGDECFTMNISTSKPIDTIADSLDVVPLGDVNSISNRHTYRVAADYVLLATGSSREGHQWAEQLGHNIVSPVPSLFTLTIADSRIDGLAGVAVQVRTSL